MADVRSVLVVDDDLAMREMLVSLLEDRGLQACGASSVAEALIRLRKSDFDAVLSDIRMPGTSGLELLGQYHEVRPTTPVIVMTAFGTDSTEQDAQGAGAFGYLAKPFEAEVLLSTLERAFEVRREESH
jgi:DNA-binding NtrC family response regulator